VIAASVPGKKDSAAVLLQAAESMRSFNIIPRHSEWDTIFWEQFQDPLYHDKGTVLTCLQPYAPRWKNYCRKWLLD
jgi:hypothetical protein